MSTLHVLLSPLGTHKNLIRYFFIGVSAAILDVLGYIYLYEVRGGMHAYVATSISVATAMVYAFLLNYFFNFGIKDRIFARFVQYAAVSVAGLLVSAVILFVLTDLLGLNGTIIKLLTLPVIFLLQYSLNVRFSFKETEVDKTFDAAAQQLRGKRVAIVGAGFTGLTAAYKLAHLGATVVVYERGPDVGGLAGGFTMAGAPLEKAYHFLYKTDRYIHELAKELGIEKMVAYYPSSIGFFYQGVVYPFTTAFDLLKFSPLSLIDRIRTGVVGVVIQTVTNWEPLQKHTAYQWLKVWCGARVTQVIWEPLLRGKFDRYYNRITMSWLWGRIAIRAQSRSASGVERLGYLHGGFTQIIKKLTEKIAEHGGVIYTDTEIVRVQKCGQEMCVVLSKETAVFDSVVFTTPAHVAVQLLEGNAELTDDYRDQVASVEYLDAVVMPFATTKQIGPYFWYNIADERIPFLCLLSTSALVGTEAFGGKHIYYIGAYVPRTHRYMTMDTEAIADEWFYGLHLMFPEFDRTDVTEHTVFRFKDAQHIVDVGFRERKLLPYETPVPGAFLANFAQIYPDDRGTNFAVREGNVIAQRVAEFLVS